MKHTLMGTGLALTFAVGLAAQAPATPAGQDQPKAGQSASAEKSVTVKGCLRAGDQAGTFVLANASTAMETTGTAGTAAAPAAAAPAIKNQTLRLIGAPAGVSLKDHVGHTVEVTGMIAPQGAKSSTPAGTSGTPAAGAGAAASDGPSLNVKSVKHVDPKCGGE